MWRHVASGGDIRVLCRFYLGAFSMHGFRLSGSPGGAAQEGLTEVVGAGLCRYWPPQASCLAPWCQRRRHWRAVCGWPGSILASVLECVPPGRLPQQVVSKYQEPRAPCRLARLVEGRARHGRAGGVLGRWTLDFARAGWLGRCRLSSGGPQGRETIAVSFTGAWHELCRAPCEMGAPSWAISESSAAGGLVF